jgi:hypothetical protein
VLHSRLENESERTVGVAAEIIKFVREDSLCCSRDSNVAASEYKPEASLFEKIGHKLEVESNDEVTQMWKKGS